MLCQTVIVSLIFNRMNTLHRKISAKSLLCIVVLTKIALTKIVLTKMVLTNVV
jgi:hypothetical protein